MVLHPQKICIAGKNQIAVDALLYLIERGWRDRLTVCPNQTDSGTSNWQPSLIRYARAYDVEIVTLETAQKTEDLVFISLEFDRLIQPAAFRTERLYNIHFSALPAYKGMYTSALPILHGAVHSGVTLHEIDSGIDTGRIIAQTLFDLPDSWTARDLYFAYMDHGLELFRKNFDRLVSHNPPDSSSQPAKNSTYFSRSTINYADVQINLRDTADGIIRQLRAFSFREYQTPVVHGIEVGGWEIMPEASHKRPGKVLSRDSENITLATIDYRLRLVRSRVWDWFALAADSAYYDIDSAFIDVRDKNGWTPLIRAAYAGDVRLCHRLLEAGADPNRANTNGTTPLMYALSGKNPDEVAKTLLRFGARPEQQDRFGNDLMMYHPSFKKRA